MQSLASKNPSDGQALAAAAAMSVKRKGLHHKADLAIRQPVSGTVNLTAKASRDVKACAWQYSLDGGTTWLDLPVTTQAATTIHALIPGARISARVRRLTKAGMGDWSQPASSLVT